MKSVFKLLILALLASSTTDCFSIKRDWSDRDEPNNTPSKKTKMPEEMTTSEAKSDRLQNLV